MHIKALTVGQIQTNCYIVSDEATRECAVIDPGDESNTIMDYLESNKLSCKYILITHGHFDHVLAAREVQSQTGAPLYIHEADCGGESPFSPFPLKPDANTRYYAQGDVITLGSLKFHIIETPGHTPGGVCLICGDAIFTGDTLFRGTCGRTDLQGGDMNTLLRSLLKIAALPGDYEVYPGHEGASTLETERRTNECIIYAREHIC